jgi:serine/threonine protein kinase
VADRDYESARDVLVGMLALQVGFVTRDTLDAALIARGPDRHLGRILVERKALSGDERALLELLAGKHIERHGGDPWRSLTALGHADSVRPAGREPTVHPASTLPHRADDPDEPCDTTTQSVGAPTAPDQRFHILRPLARGGLGEVSIAFDAELHREVAIKVLQGRHADDAQSRARFLLEAEITGSLEHPGIVSVYGLGRYADGRPFYAMRLIRGESLKDALAHLHHPEGAGRLSDERNWELRKLLHRFLDVCNAMEYAHNRGVLHRDLKPSNIMLGDYGETLVVDWGLAKLRGRPDADAGRADAEAPLHPVPGDDPAPTLVGRAIGTWHYMSPEQAAGEVDRLGPASDVYSLGATLYHMLTGQPPFKGVPTAAMLGMIQGGHFAPPREVKPDVPAPLEAICLKAMARELEDRYPSARALAEDLERWLADEPLAAYRSAVAQHEARIRAHPGRVRDREALARIHSNLGNALHFLGRNVEAEAVHRRAIAQFHALVDQQPLSAEYREELAVAYGNLGWVLRALGRKDDADAAYNASLAEYKQVARKSQQGRTATGNPGLTALFVSQGWPSAMDSMAGLPPGVEPEAQEVATSPEPTPPEAGRSRGPDDANAHFQRGKAFSKQGEIDRAIAEFTAALRLDPGLAEAYNRRGNALLDRGEHIRAIADYSHAIGLDPNDPVFYYNRGKAYDAGGDQVRAIADYTEAIGLDPQFTKARIRRSKAYNTLGL